MDLPAADASHLDFQDDSEMDVIDDVNGSESMLSEEYFVGAAQIFGRGTSFVDKFNADRFSAHRDENLYYPFASLQEWKLAQWLLRCGLSMSATNEFLSLELVSLRLQFSIIFIYIFLDPQFRSLL